jgi:hypothetical protein
MALASPDAITVMRVEGGMFVAIATVLAYCIASDRRVLAGLGLLTTLITAITATRLLGLALDGPGPFTLMVLKPEVVLVVLSAVGFFLEWQRSQRLGAVTGQGSVRFDSRVREARRDTTEPVARSTGS